ncbi:BspA family leucine-rich repeat surface protein [Actinomycetaceae bacterium MB13-C1-2]|nr:BspA family leucine-rich repeat surface protein [Actinomycetaceae bacterium MB13-C1-2]
MNRVLASATAIAVAFTLNFGGAAVAAESSGEAPSGGPARSVTTATADVAANEASTSRRAPMSGDAAGSVATVNADASEVGPGQARGVSLSGDAADFGEGEVPPALSSVAEDTAQGTSEQTPSTAELDEGTLPTDPPALGDGVEEDPGERSDEGASAFDTDEDGADGLQSLEEDDPALLGTQSQSPTPIGADGDAPVPAYTDMGSWGQVDWSFDGSRSPKTLTLHAPPPGLTATLGGYSTAPWNGGSVAPADVEQIVFETGTPGAIKFPVNSSALFAVSDGFITSGLANLVGISGLTGVDTSGVTNMSRMFLGAESLRSLDLSGWQTGAVEGMTRMFASTNALESIVGIEAWDTRQVTNMDLMFNSAISIESLDLSSWDTANAGRWAMFSDASSLASLTLGPKTDLSGSFLPNASNAEGYTGKWVRLGQLWGYPAIPWWSGTGDGLATFSAGADDSAGTYVWQQKAPVTLDLNYGKWPDMEAAWEAELTALGDAAVGEVVKLPNVAPVLDPAKFGNNAFDKWKGAVSGDHLTVSPGFQFVVPQPGVTLKASWTSELQLWGEAPWQFDTASGTLTVYGSDDPANPRVLGGYTASPWNRTDTNRVDPDAVEKIVFENPTGIKFPVNSSKLFAVYILGATTGLTNLKSISGLAGVDTSDATDMSQMFFGAQSLESLDLSGWQTGQVQDMSQMFQNAAALRSLDLTGWQTDEVRDMSRMFSYARSLESIAGTGGWDTRKVTNASFMFYSASALKSLDLSSWDTTAMSNLNTFVMLYDTSSLESLTLGPKTDLSDSGLPSLSQGGPHTGKWVRTGPAPSSTEAWWSGTSAALLTRSQDPMTAAGTYVWQEKVQVGVDLGSGDWKAEDNPTNLDPLSQAAVGTLVSLPDRDPVWADHDFLGWELSVPGNAPVPVSADFIVTESGLELVATWADTTFELVFDLDGGTPSSAFAAQEGTVGQNLTIPAQVPTRGGVFIFDGWLHEGTATTYQPGGEFTMLSGGATLKAQWTPSWGDAPWQFDAATGTLTVYGNDDPANPRVLGGYTASPWNRADGSQVDPAGIKKIVFEDPTGIKFPADSRRLFTAGTDPWVPGPMSNLSEIEGIGQVDTSAVTNMAYMFMYGASLTSLDLSGWDTGEVEYLVNTFSYMSALKTLNLTDWNTEKVQSIAGTFSYTPVLESIAGLGSWNTAGVTSMQNTFNGASSLKSLDLSNWDTTGANRTGMLSGTSSLESLTLGPKTVQTNSGLPDASSTGDHTGNWVRTGPDPSSTEAWWRGTSTELESRSQNPAEAAGTYVWQKKAPVTLDLNYGEWPDM